MKVEEEQGLKKVLDGLRKTPTASLSDALDQMGVRGFISHEFRPLIQGHKIVGPALTIKHQLCNRVASFIPALEAIDEAKQGTVLVIAGDADLRDVGLFGGLMATASKARGLAGAVLDGGVRDTREIREMGFQVFSRSVIPTTSIGRTELVGVNVPLICGGVTVQPGDIIVGDDDGVVVIPKDRVGEALERALRFDEVEVVEAEELRKGASFVETIKKHARV